MLKIRDSPILNIEDVCKEFQIENIEKIYNNYNYTYTYNYEYEIV